MYLIEQIEELHADQETITNNLEILQYLCELISAIVQGCSQKNKKIFVQNKKINGLEKILIILSMYR